MNLLLIQVALRSASPRLRGLAVDKLERQRNLFGLVRVLNECIYKGTVEEAEIALAKYQFK